MSDGSKYDLLLKGGKVIDPKNNRNQLLDLACKDGKIACVEPEIEAGLSDHVVDVSGMYITPGLIDIHVHVYHTREPEGLSIVADHHSFRSGVTTVVDAGTAGQNTSCTLNAPSLIRPRRVFWLSSILSNPA